MKFLDSLKNVNFLFLPNFFPDLSQTTDNYSIPEYEPFTTNTSFLYNCSPFIVIFGFVIVVYFIFFVLSRKVSCLNKTLRKTAHRIRKYRLRYMIINDAFWFTYLFTVFMALLQFTQASFSSTWDIVNIAFASIVFLFFLVYTVFIMYLGNKFKNSQPPKKYIFLKM